MALFETSFGKRQKALRSQALKDVERLSKAIKGFRAFLKQALASFKKPCFHKLRKTLRRVQRLSNALALFLTSFCKLQKALRSQALKDLETLSKAIKGFSFDGYQLL